MGSPSPTAADAYIGTPLKTYKVNLDLPPRDRYREIARDYSTHLHAITPLFDEVLSPLPCSSFIKFVARRMLRRVYSAEENAEIDGMVEATGLQRFFFVAFNSFLDVFMGCTSGAVRVYDPEDEDKSRMLHLRSLDWGMEELRSMSILVEYIRGGQVVAKGITYAGYVGVLTGVRQGLSLSLNFRPASDDSTGFVSLRGHQLLVLLGMRPSISHTLRTLLLPSEQKTNGGKSTRSSGSSTDEKLLVGKEAPPKLADILDILPTTKSSPCYILLCDGQSSAVLEKDISTAKIHTSSEFIASTNHDVHMEKWTAEHWENFKNRDVVGMKELVADSMERKNCVKRLYDEATKRGKKVLFLKSKYVGTGKRPKVGCHNVVRWLETWPVRNECTHFSCVLDPQNGDIAWTRRYEDMPREYY